MSETGQSDTSAEYLSCSPVGMHGHLGNKQWDPPTLMFFSQEASRPGYNEQTNASEYREQPHVFTEKIALLSSLLLSSSSLVTYTGAGLSTSSGIADYASRHEIGADGSQSGEGEGKKMTHPYDALPTPAHHVLVSLHRVGILKHWIQQNHDGLPQKAGFPQRHMTEIHGSWYDPSNPVIPMSGTLRDDLFASLLYWEQEADLVLTLGTSLSGMNADRVVVSANERAKKWRSEMRKRGEKEVDISEKVPKGERRDLGSVIVSLQRTPMDTDCSLRIFATIDDVLTELAKVMNLPVGEKKEEKREEESVAKNEEEFVYELPYDENGNPTEGGTKRRLDLREDAKMKITRGQFAGDRGIVVDRNAAGHIRIQFKHNIGRGKKFMAPMMRIVGIWWIEDAIKGEAPYLPVVNCDDNEE